MSTLDILPDSLCSVLSPSTERKPYLAPEAYVVEVAFSHIADTLSLDAGEIDNEDWY